jgi:hypothetical protein
MSGRGPNAAHHRAAGARYSSIICWRGVPSTTGGSHWFSRIESIRVVSNGPATAASDHPNEAMSNAHGHARSTDWSSTMSAAHRIDSAKNGRSCGVTDSASDRGERHAAGCRNRGDRRGCRSAGRRAAQIAQTRRGFRCGDRTDHRGGGGHRRPNWRRRWSPQPRTTGISPSETSWASVDNTLLILGVTAVVAPVGGRHRAGSGPDRQSGGGRRHRGVHPGVHHRQTGQPPGGRSSRHALSGLSDVPAADRMSATAQVPIDPGKRCERCSPIPVSNAAGLISKPMCWPRCRSRRTPLSWAVTLQRGRAVRR